MTEVLTPVTQYPPEYLAEGLFKAVIDALPELRQRGQHDVVAAYGAGVPLGIDALVRAERAHRNRQARHYVMEDDGRIVGGATIVPEPVVRHRNPFLGGDVAYPHAGLHISAWSPDRRRLLAAYRRLVETCLTDATGDTYRPVWTTEPHRSPGDIHRIILAGTRLQAIGSGRFATPRGDRQSGAALPGMLYAARPGGWRRAAEARRDLRLADPALAPERLGRWVLQATAGKNVDEAPANE